MRRGKKSAAAAAAVLVLIALAVWLWPRSLGKLLKVDGLPPDGTVYCTFFDLTRGDSWDWSGPAEELLSPSGGGFGGLLDGVSLSGPVFSRRGAANPELLNLYLSLPRQDGTYRQVTVECILSRAAPSGSYSAFLNIDGRGYLVASGKQAVARFIQDCRPTNLS